MFPICPLICQSDGCAEVLIRAVGSGRNPKWCAVHRAALRLAAPRDSATKTCSEDGCQRPLRARGFCGMHYKTWARSEGRIVQEGWTDRRRNNHHARRALIKGTSSEGTVTLADILERDGDDCRICLDAVDMALKWPHPFSQSLDHIVPIARGGAHVQSNCQLAHLRCNISKGANVA